MITAKDGFKIFIVVICALLAGLIALLIVTTIAEAHNYNNKQHQHVTIKHNHGNWGWHEHKNIINIQRPARISTAITITAPDTNDPNTNNFVKMHSREGTTLLLPHQHDGSVDAPPKPKQPTPQSPNTPQRSPHHIDEISDISRIGDCSDELEDGAVEFVMSLQRGYNRVSIPLLNPTIRCEPIEFLSDFMSALGADNYHYAYGVNDDRFQYRSDGYNPDYQACSKCEDKNDHIRDREITPQYGWNLVMNRTTEIIIRGMPVTEYEMTIYSGRKNYGIPLQDTRIETITDLFQIFTNVTYIDYYDTDRKKQWIYKTTISDDTFVGGTSYFINADSDLTVPLSGKAWTELIPTAPPIRQHRQTLTTTWGAMKK